MTSPVIQRESSEAMKARIAFITDIRRANLHMLLMYKALFELSADRAEFLSRLFVKARPAGLSKSSTIKELTDAYWLVATGDEAAYSAGLQAIQNQLTRIHGFKMSEEDVAGVARAYRAFYYYGPRMNYSASLDLTAIGGGNAATYFDLMNQLGDDGQPLSYLGTEAKFAYIKDLQAKIGQLACGGVDVDLVLARGLDRLIANARHERRC